MLGQYRRFCSYRWRLRDGKNPLLGLRPAQSLLHQFLRTFGQMTAPLALYSLDFIGMGIFAQSDFEFSILLVFVRGEVAIIVFGLIQLLLILLVRLRGACT